MKILYISEEKSVMPFSAKDCYLKKIQYKNDYKMTTLKSHSHIDFEIHMLVRGTQSYEIGDRIYEIKENEFLLISPGEKHRCISASKDMEKFTLTFSSNFILEKPIWHEEIGNSIYDSLYFILGEYDYNSGYFSKLIENRVFEILCLIFRVCGHYDDKSNIMIQPRKDNDKLFLAKKFISDNIKNGISVNDVASYYCLSIRQLTRLFVREEGITLFEYMRKEKMQKICNCLKNEELSLKEISEQFSYANESYFTTSFKKYFGITPLTYRNMHKQ